VNLDVSLEIFNVKYTVGKVRINENIQIQVDVAQDVPGKGGRHVNVAVIISQSAVRLRKAKDVVPAIQPIIFQAARAAGNRSQEIVNDFVREGSIEDNQRAVAGEQL